MSEPKFEIRFQRGGYTAPEELEIFILGGAREKAQAYSLQRF